MTGRGHRKMNAAELTPHMEVAHDWLTHLYSGQADEADHQRFSAWLDEDEAHAAAFARTNELWEQIPLAENIEEALDHNDAGTIPLPVREPKAPILRSRWQWVAAIAACLLLCVGTYHVLQNPTPEPQRYYTAMGERKTVQLADGSSVTLEAESAIVVNLTADRREIDLALGGAYFDVVMDGTRPFSVKADHADIRVLGTAFDVRRNATDMRIAVAEGVIAVSNSRGPETSKQLQAGHQLIIGSDGELSEVSQFDPATAFSWLEGRLVYDNVALRDVLVEVNRYRDKKIILANEALGDIRVTTSFPSDQSDKMLAGLLASKPLYASEGAGRITLLPKR